MTQVSRVCGENIWKAVSAVKNPPILATVAAIASLLALTAYFFPKARACFRWPVSLLTSAGAAAFSRFFSSSEVKKTKESSIQEEPLDPLLKAVERATNILKDHGKYSASAKEISAYIGMLPADQQKRFLNDSEKPEDLCLMIEESLYTHAFESLKKLEWGQIAANMMKWVDILTNLQKKPNPHQAVHRARDIACRSRELLGDRCSSFSYIELFPIANFLTMSLGKEREENLDAWSEKDLDNFLDALADTARDIRFDHKHLLLSDLDMLKNLTEKGYTIEEIDAANAYMNKFGAMEMVDLWTQATQVLSIARRASKALEEHAPVKYSFVKVLFAANIVKIRAGEEHQASYEADPKTLSEAVARRIISNPGDSEE